jgi:hypothetical protein
LILLSGPLPVLLFHDLLAPRVPIFLLEQFENPLSLLKKDQDSFFSVDNHK